MSAKLPLFTATDLATLAGLPVLTALAWVTGESTWSVAGNAMAPLAGPFAIASINLPQCIAALLELRDGAAGGARILREMLAHQVEETLQLMACHRPGGWRPTTELRGADHLLKALAAGSGAVLWIGNSAFSSLTVKMALHDTGFRLHHLSHPRHGFSPSKFGMRWLNPVRTRIEAKYLASRAVLPLNGNAGPVLARLIDRLRDGNIVSVTAGATSLRPLTVRFLTGSLRLAPGAPGLAHRAGAPLLPVFATREAIDRHVVTIEPPLALPRGVPSGQMLEGAAQAFVQRLETHIRRHPGAWFGWADASEKRADMRVAVEASAAQ
jgi:lauroyl/myristoyl acyltransferase